MARAPSIDSEAISQIINETVIPPLKKEQFAEKLVVAHPEIPEPELVHSDMSSIIKDDTAKVSPGVIDPSQPIAYVAVEEELLEEHLASELVGEPELVHSDMSSIIKDDTAKVSPGVIAPSQPIAYVAVAEELLEEHFESELVGEPELVHSDMSSIIKDDTAKVSPGVVDPSQPIAYVAVEEELLEEHFASELVGEPELVHSDMSSIIKDDTAKVSSGVIDPSQPIAYVAVAEELLEEHFESELVGEPVKKVAQESIDKFISFKDKFQQVTVIDVEKDHNLTKDHDLSEESPYKYGG